MIIDGRYRWETIYKNKPNPQHHQIYTFTLMDRYPLLFSETKKYFLNHQKNPSPKILSFGCSTGEEVFSLGEYFSAATIVGIDVNQWCINQCIKKNTNSKHLFYNRNSKEFEKLNNFDAIFCMAVLQRSENRTSVNNSVSVLYPFSKFESEINLLNQKLKVGGLIIIESSDFLFIDSKCSANYLPLQFENNEIESKRPLFNKHNKKVSESQTFKRIFIKIK
jgi:hypothetical protein